METLVGKDSLNNRIGIGISDNLESAVEEALTNIKDSKSILVNIIGPEDISLLDAQASVDWLKEDRDITYSLSISKELTDKYIVFILKEA